MINLFNFFYKFNEDLRNNNLNEDKDLIKYFKSEFGKEWKIELDKYLIKAEHDIDKKLLSGNKLPLIYNLNLNLDRFCDKTNHCKKNM